MGDRLVNESGFGCRNRHMSKIRQRRGGQDRVYLGPGFQAKGSETEARALDTPGGVWWPVAPCQVWAGLQGGRGEGRSPMVLSRADTGRPCMPS